MNTPGNPSVEIRPASELTKIALDGLRREFRRNVAVVSQAAAEVEGVDLEAGWQLDVNTGTWVRATAEPPKAPTAAPASDG